MNQNAVYEIIVKIWCRDAEFEVYMQWRSEDVRGPIMDNGLSGAPSHTS